MVSFDQFQPLHSLGLFEESFGMFDVDEGVINAPNEKDGASDFADYFDGLQLSQVKV